MSSDRKMSIERAKKILGKKAENLNDRELQVLINHLYSLAEILVDDFLYKKIPEKERNLYNLNAYQSKNKKRDSIKVT